MTDEKRDRLLIDWLASLRRGAWVPLSVSAVLTALMLAFGRAASVERVAMLFLTNTIVAFSIGTAVMFGFGVVLPRLRSEARPLGMRLLLEGGVIMVATVVGTEIAVQLIARFITSAHFPREDVLWVALPVTFTATVVTVALGRAKEQRALATERREIAERELLRAELAALKARVQPHFLFNSLNTIAALIEEDPKAAEQALLELSALFRYTLDVSEKARVSIGEELSAVRRYLRFEQLRFEDRLRVDIDVAPEAAEVRVPPLLLQPLVENAVAHGVSSRKEGGRVLVTVRISGEVLEVTVDDDGPGPSGSTRAGSGTARRDLDKRLALSYGGDARLETGRSALGGFSAKLFLPLAGPLDAGARPNEVAT
jgi:two-component system sensor histidine kinase AlgZ